MEANELRDMIARLRAMGSDDLTCEAKRAKGGLPATTWETVSAFANADGGCLILGVDEASDFAITGVDDAGATEAHLASLCSDVLEPPVRPEITTVRLNGKSVVVCAVPPLARDRRPCHKRSLGPWAGSRLRVADGDRKLTDYEVTVLLSNREEQRHDLRPIASASIEDLDPILIRDFLERIRDIKGQIFRRLDDQQALRMLKVLTEHDGSLVPTLAGLLTFGIYPQSFEPQLNVTFVAYPGTEPGVLGKVGERFIENRSIDGPIPMVVSECIRVLKRNMRRRSIVSGIYRIDEWEYPEEVLREALVNALVHRDYSEFARGMQVQVEMYPDRLLVRNAGGLYGPVDVGTLGTNTVTSSRNRTLLKILEDMPLGDGHMVCENRGTGIARMALVLSEAGMEPPRFSDDISVFSVEFPNHALLTEETIAWLTELGAGPFTRSQTTALALMRSGMELTNSSYRSSTGVQDSRTASRELKDLVDRGIVEQFGSRGGTTYRLTSDRAEQLTIEDRSDRESEGSLRDNEARILELLADGSLSRAEIEKRAGLAMHQVLHALNTLRQKGYIETIGKPRSPNVRWTVRKGRW
ncbi:ATP-binding protein [Actinoplanes sp. NPDC051470]|uniref:ATP-binding protein n=1 Tax=Actinoplanes sp. NPDC051470 TaxID=3157224 RepID=UPI003448B362